MRISWSRRGGDGGSLYDDGRGTLVLSRVTASDSGVYVCTATDGTHVSDDEAQVMVREADVGGGGGGAGGNQGGEERSALILLFPSGILHVYISH